MTGVGLLAMIVLEMQLLFPDKPILDNLDRIDFISHEEMQKHAPNIVELPPSFIKGVCVPLTGRVYLNRDYWDVAPLHHKKRLVFHELAHCVLNMRHRFGYSNIMSQNMEETTEENFALHKEQLRLDYLKGNLEFLSK